ncbi:MAG: tetratricopeptide repeat protein [Bacteroidia bacterium]|nr:tetratricopeptide repeat protein [Bacteroidia bacterium]
MLLRRTINPWKWIPILVMLTLPAGLCQAVTVHDSLYALLATQPDDTTRADLLTDIGRDFFFTDTDSAMFWWERALTLSEQLAESEVPAIRYKGKKGVALNCNRLAVIYQYRGLYAQALKFYQRCIRVSGEIGFQEGKIKAMGNIGIIKKEQKQYPEALQYFGQCLVLARENAMYSIQASCYNNAGIALREMNEPELAMKAYHKSLRLARQVGNQIQEVDNYINISVILVEKGKADSALVLLKRSEFMADSLEYGLALTSIYVTTAEALIHLERLNEAEDYLMRGIAMARKHGITEELLAGYEMAGRLFELKGDFRRSNDFLKLLIGLKDSTFNVNKSIEFGQLEASFSYERQEYERALAETAAAQARRKTQFTQYLIAFASLCVFALLMIVVVRRSKVGTRLRSLAVFASLIFFFEFVLVLLDNYVDAWTAGTPIPKLILNIILAILFTWLHNQFERRLLKHS